jgi:hypothetical protein
VTLRALGDTTVVKVEEAVLGRVDENTVPRLREGWRVLMGQALKGHVEARPLTA